MSEYQICTFVISNSRLKCQVVQIHTLEKSAQIKFACIDKKFNTILTGDENNF